MQNPKHQCHTYRSIPNSSPPYIPPAPKHHDRRFSEKVLVLGSSSSPSWVSFRTSSPGVPRRCAFFVAWFARVSVVRSAVTLSLYYPGSFLFQLVFAGQDCIESFSSCPRIAKKILCSSGCVCAYPPKVLQTPEVSRGGNYGGDDIW